jgi:hypothetical protein
MLPSTPFCAAKSMHDISHNPPLPPGDNYNTQHPFLLETPQTSAPTPAFPQAITTQTGSLLDRPGLPIPAHAPTQLPPLVPVMDASGHLQYIPLPVAVANGWVQLQPPTLQPMQEAARGQGCGRGRGRSSAASQRRRRAASETFPRELTQPAQRRRIEDPGQLVNCHSFDASPLPLSWAPSPWTFHIPIHFNSNLRFYFTSSL